MLRLPGFAPRVDGARQIVASEFGGEGPHVRPITIVEQPRFMGIIDVHGRRKRASDQRHGFVAGRYQYVDGKTFGCECRFADFDLPLQKNSRQRRHQRHQLGG